MTATNPFGDGRDSAGRFVAGNRGGPGNPHGGQVAALRAAMLEAVTPDDLAAVIRLVVQRAREGEPWAVKELLDRTLGRAAVSVTVEADQGPSRVVHYVVKPPRLLDEPGRVGYQTGGIETGPRGGVLVDSALRDSV